MGRVNKSTVARRAIKPRRDRPGQSARVRVSETQRGTVRRGRGRGRGRGRRGGESTGKQGAAEITAIIAIEVRTGRCLLNPIGNRREVEGARSLLSLPSITLPRFRGREEERESVVHPEKNGRTVAV